MCFVDNDQVPLGVLELFLEIFIAGELVQTADKLVGFIKEVARRTLFLFFTAENLELDAKFLQQFILPLFGESARRDDEDPFGIRTHEQLTNQQASHDGFTRPGVVCQYEAQGLTGQHGLIHC